jgi:hypothetical protein
MAQALAGYYPTRLARPIGLAPPSSTFALSGPGAGPPDRAANFNHDRGKCKLETGAWPPARGH